MNSDSNRMFAASAGLSSKASHTLAKTSPGNFTHIGHGLLRINSANRAAARSRSRFAVARVFF
jgi:hypothetical protein